MDLVDEEISNDPFGMDAAMGSRNRPGQRNYRDLALYGKKMVKISSLNILKFFVANFLVGL